MSKLVESGLFYLHVPNGLFFEFKPCQIYTAMYMCIVVQHFDLGQGNMSAGYSTRSGTNEPCC